MLSLRFDWLKFRSVLKNRIQSLRLMKNMFTKPNVPTVLKQNTKPLDLNQGTKTKVIQERVIIFLDGTK